MEREGEGEIGRGTGREGASREKNIGTVLRTILLLFLC